MQELERAGSESPRGEDRRLGEYQALFYPESRLLGFSGVDGTVAFYVAVNAALRGDDAVLDVGCGRGARADDPVEFRRALATLRGRCRCVLGIDLDPAAATNPTLDEFRLIEGRRWPVADESIDVCIADWVLEHIDEPDAFFAECRRVLRPGGYLHIRTPNVLSYFGLLSRFIPERRHGAVLRWAQPTRREEDVFPKYYRCNTMRTLRTVLDRHGFTHVVRGYEPEPGYLGFSRVAYALGVLYQRLAPSALRTNLLVHARKEL